MAGTLDVAVSATQARTLDAQSENSRPNLRRFAMLVVPLALLLVTFKAYSLEQPAFLWLTCLVFGGFAVWYWLPFHFKETFLISLSLAGAYFLLSPIVASLLIASGLLFFSIVRSSLTFRWKVLLLLGILSGLAYGRATGRFPIPAGFWPVFGAIFMFRMIVYLYDVKYAPGPVRLRDFLSYFFLLPNYYFLLFPVVDFQTFRKSYFKRDIHAVAQQGVWWIVRGTVQLLLYRLIYQAQGSFSPPKVPVLAAVIAKSVLCYLLYLRVSGQFHIIVGMLHLFGYDLPQTNRLYLLASSISDFWRRVNIYWKDFMVKVFYFPAYFKLRRKGEVRAQLLATMLVFVVTWFLHGYQFFWLKGTFRITWNDTLFWASLCFIVMADVWIQSKRPKRLPETGWASRARQVFSIAGTLLLISFLWSMWSVNSISEWLYFLRTGTI